MLINWVLFKISLNIYPFLLFSEKNILKGIDGIGFYEFNKEDVVRHTLVKSIIEAYDEKK